MAEPGKISTDWLARQMGIDIADVRLAVQPAKPNAAGEYSADAIPFAFAFLRRERDFIQQTELAQLLGITPARVSSMIREGVLEQDSTARLDRRKNLHRAFQWMRERMGEGKTTIGTAKAEGTRLDNELKRLAVQKAIGAAIDAKEVERAWGNLILHSRQAFLHLGNKLAPRMVYLKSETEIADAIQEAIDEALTHLARPVEYGQEDAPKQLELAGE